LGIARKVEDEHEYVLSGLVVSKEKIPEPDVCGSPYTFQTDREKKNLAQGIVLPEKIF